MNPTFLKQGSSEWLAERAGKCTASRVKDALSVLKNGEPSAKRKNYMVELVVERLTGMTAQHFMNDAMVWGSETESLARAAYEQRMGVEVDLVGLVPHPTIANFAASPDGRVGEKGLVEFKCPQTATHVEWILEGIVPPEHEYQMLAQMACEGREWCDFVSFDPRIAPRHELFIRRLMRDDARILKMEEDVREFLAQVDGMVASLETINPPLKEALRASVEMPELTGDPEQDWRLMADSLLGDERVLSA